MEQLTQASFVVDATFLNTHITAFAQADDSDVDDELDMDEEEVFEDAEEGVGWESVSGTAESAASARSVPWSVPRDPILVQGLLCCPDGVLICILENLEDAAVCSAACAINDLARVAPFVWSQRFERSNPSWINGHQWETGECVMEGSTGSLPLYRSMRDKQVGDTTWR